MTFKVIITHPSEDDDEHTYYGMAFLNLGKVKSGRLKYSESEKELKVNLAFDGNPIKVGEKFLAILVPVNESESQRVQLQNLGYMETLLHMCQK